MPRPSEDQLDRALALIALGSSRYRYFFDTLKDPDWIAPLHARGFFTQPSRPHRSGDTISFPFWPESAFLVRMADHAATQAEILDIALAVDTENTRIHENLAEIALKLPATMSALFLPRVSAWIESPYKAFSLGKRLASLVEHLAAGGEQAAAFALARTLLRVVPRERSPESDSEFLLPEAVPVMGQFSYRQGLASIRKALIPSGGLAAFELLLELLVSSLKITAREDDTPFNDHSNVWYPSLDSSGDDDDARELLLEAVRDAAEQLVAQDGSRLRRVVQCLEDARWMAARRVALHILRKYPTDSDLVTARLLSATEPGLQREYDLLAKAQFSSLTPDAKAERLKSVGPPSIASIKKTHQLWFGQELSDTEASALAERLLRDELAPLADGLPPDWRARYQELVAKHGPARSAGETLPVSFGQFGFESPRTIEDMRTSTVAEIREYALAWQPQGGLLHASREGLSSVLARRIAEQPQDFALAAESFVSLDPTYVRSMFDGLWTATRDGKTFDWLPVLSAALKVLEQPREIVGRVGGHLSGQDPDWGWCRTSIARLVEAGLSDRPNVIPIELVGDVGKVLTRLTSDPVPTVADEAEALKSEDADPHALAINTTRGEAMGAVFDCMRWIRRAKPAATLEDMPEVAAILDRHLNVEDEPSRAVRAMYGVHLPTLYHVDERWAASNIERILPSDPEQRALRAAAWRTYLTVCPPYTFMYTSLRSYYDDAVSDLAPTRPTSRREAEAEERLVEHLCVFYARGLIGLEDEGLLMRVLAGSRADLQAHAIRFIGHSLDETEQVPTEVLNRFKALWTAYVGQDSSRAIQAFGWWVTSAAFEDEWSLDNLLAVLHNTKEVDPLYGVLERLRELVGAHPLKSTMCLQGILEGSREDALFGLGDLIRDVLAGAIDSQDAQARQLSTTLVHRMGHLGFVGFRDLLKES